MHKPNVLYLHAHDAGRLISPYGFAMPTPNLRRLATEGTLFRQAFCCGPTCSPSRAALLAGQSPHACGMTGLAHRGWSLNDYGRHIIHALRPAGYRSLLCGVQHIAAPGQIERIGYDEIVPVETHRAADVAEAAERRIVTGLPEPFFLSVGCVEPHRPFPEPESDEAARFACPPEPLPDAPETRRDTAGLAVLAERFDAMVGRVLAALGAAGLAERTLVVCTTDHGPAFPTMKCNLTDGGLGVMLVLRGPGVPKAWSTDALVSHLDLFPTLCEWLDIAPPAWLEGVSLGPLLRGEADEVREAVFGEVSYHAAYEPQRSVRTTRWKYIRRYGDRLTPVLPNCDDGPTKDLFVARGWAEQRLPREALYDLVFDPAERNNLAGDPAMRGVLGDMSRRLDGWMAETDDPLLAGPVPAPSGAKVNDPDGRSPGEPTRTVT